MNDCDKCGGEIRPTGTGRSIGSQPVLMSGECASREARYRRVSDQWLPDHARNGEDED